MNKAVIVEDEIHAQEALKKMLHLIAPSLDVVGTFTTIRSATGFLMEHSIDVLFLDVELEDGTGFQLLEALPEHQFALIFTTAFNQYAIKAFKYSAIDYLLKPIDPSELKAALGRAKKNSAPIHVLKPDTHVQQIVLPTNENNYVIRIDDIIRLEADGAYTKFYTQGRTIMVSKNLKHYESLLADHAFIRCHQSHLIAKQYITDFTKQSLTMIDGSTVPISHRRKHLIKGLK